MKHLAFVSLVFFHRVVCGLANRLLDKRQIHPRSFSNDQLKKYANHFAGDIINVSGWRDEDGESCHYRKYFSEATSYTISNVGGQSKGFGSSGHNEIELDLTAPLPRDMERAYDVVFNHTTLEHIYDIRTAFKNLCALSRDAVILVVPVMQQIHHAKDFGDYWRPTTMSIAKMFLENGLTPVVIKCNDQPFAPIYCFAIAVRDPQKYGSAFACDVDYEMGRYNYGSSLQPQHIEGLVS